MCRFKGLFRVRPLAFLGLLVAAAVCLIGNAQQASANHMVSDLRCYRFCAKLGDRAERQCLRNGGDATQCASEGSAAAWQCRIDNGCGWQGG
jgi:hypothetical protein